MTPFPEFHGWSDYASDLLVGPDRLFVAVRCVINGTEPIMDGLVDTAAEWSVLPPRIAANLGFGEATSGNVLLATRLGVFHASPERIPIRFPAVGGEAVEIEATWFVSPDWPGPLVLGWKGGLERMRFALAPREERFYFGPW